MREPNLTIFAVINSSLISPQVLVGAIIALAIILGIGAAFIWRSGKNKPNKPPLSMNGTSDWQRQAQPGSAGGWNPQQQGQPQTNWNAPNAAAQQNSWGGAGAPQQAQAQQAANPWGGGTPSQPSWGGMPQPPAANPWGGNPAQPEQPQWGSNPAQQDQWGGNNPAQPPTAANPWGAPNTQQPQPQAQWGNQTGGAGQAAPWDPAQAAAPVTQDPWGQQQPPITGQQWGASPAAPQQPQAPVSGWGQPPAAPADPWGATPKPQSPPSGSFPNQAAAPQQWQQGQGQPGYGQDANTMYAGGADVDKTMLRAPGQQTGTIGYVRVEEGKEPGRIYEIKKESLSMGRSRESDIFLEDLAVSRLHASLVNMGNGSYALKDEGSANGTKVNGQLVNKFQTYPLQEGDRIQLGQTVLAFAKK
jgi:hypothetical protein